MLKTSTEKITKRVDLNKKMFHAHELLDLLKTQY